jgi:Nucleotide-diphospho-sugar transferase
MNCKQAACNNEAYNEASMQGSCLLCSGYDGRYKFGILPVSTFCSGHTFFTQRMHEKLKLQPYVVHATFQFSGTPGKRHRMREFMLWHVSAVCYFIANG